MKEEIKGMQRLFKLGLRYSERRLLMADNLDSAFQLSRLGPNVLRDKYGEILGDPILIHEQASQTSATALTLLTQFCAQFNGIKMPVLPKPVQQVDGMPNWQTLFGSFNLCACEHCRSVYSPSAYLVDILYFLNDRRVLDKTKSKYESAKNKLFERRPDIGDIELTCENTNTPLPYVDLVNEILEDAIAPPASLPKIMHDPSLLAALNQGYLSADLQEALNVSNHAVIEVQDPGKWLSIHGSDSTYTISKNDQGQLQTSRGRQTRGTPQQLKANPQYINARAYNKLRDQVFPWSLPFDLWLEEARIYLDHLGVPRHELMATFSPKSDRPDILTDEAIACEYLGLSSEEFKIITGNKTSPTGAIAPGVWHLWGFSKENLDPNNSIPD